MHSYSVCGENINTISIFDRGLNYGDGVFETIAVNQFRPVFWNQHLARLVNGCNRLKIPPVDLALLATEAKQLIDNSQGILKIIITRGCGGNGYKSLANPQPNRVLQFLPWPDNIEQHAKTGINVYLCQTRLAKQPILAGIKHLNRLEQVLGSMEWSSNEYMEGLMFDQDTQLIEGTKTNVFIIKDNKLFTPDVKMTGIDGIIRQQVLNLAKEVGIEVNITHLSKPNLFAADEVFVCNSIIGIWPVLTWNSRKTWPLTQLIQTALEKNISRDISESKNCI